VRAVNGLLLTVWNVCCYYAVDTCTIGNSRREAKLGSSSVELVFELAF